MTMHSFKSLIAVSAVILTSTLAQAQELKVGYVSVERLYRESNFAKASSAKLDAEYTKRGKELEDTALKIKAAAEKLDKDAPTLAESERNRRQRELVEQDRELQRKRREYSEDLNLRRNEEMDALRERAQRVIKQLAEQEKYDLILQDAIHFSARLDITDKVIRALNAPGGK